MLRIFQVGGVLLVAAVAGVCADQAKAVKPPPPPKKEAPFRGGPRGGGAGVPKGPPIVSPASPAARLYQASPGDRDRVIERLPAAQQVRVRKQLAYFDGLSKPDQQMMIERTERFNAFTPEKRQAFNLQMQNMNHLMPDRQRAVRQALRRLEVMPEARRVMVLNSDVFKNSFSPEEQKIIADLSEVMLPPM
jgi:hypothetical protein